ncbi:hypothetical protein G7067_01985 [Leucobacter insecticola]|uniref:Uncharacterized protein n=1 Tax=Leucobacter insecticola TaxID=2714934 RepID=A0A6G8FGI7_9MICO|nr:hypothetical protein [Leucobacter insecticola]QIM15457.1 hypothetical protein G7067_01985 [Leucobacter insecticola]
MVLGDRYRDPNDRLVRMSEFLSEHTWDIVIGVVSMVVSIVVTYLLNNVPRGRGDDW